MNNADVIIIGAGISGLVAARELCKAGRRVIILEARNRCGGRIHTLAQHEFPVIAETGAEFIHGKLPATIGLLNEYKIPYTRVEGDVWRVFNGNYERTERMIAEHEDELKSKLKELESDMSVQQFLNTRFPESQFQQLHDDVVRFVEGYDGADAARASAFALREEFDQVEDWKQYRVKGGFTQLIAALEKDCRDAGCVIHLETEVISVEWSPGSVLVKCADGKNVQGTSALITLPLGVLQSEAVQFSPSLSMKEEALHRLGFSHVIKILLCFRERFWASAKIRERIGVDLSQASFIFSDAAIPTWWTQYPEESTLLTGWLAGTGAGKRSFYPEEDIYKEAIASLSSIFKISEQNLFLQVRCRKVMHWSQQRFTQGAYTYSTVNGDKNIAVLGRPVENTLFFAGETFAPDAGIGLVEAAIESGSFTAKQMILREKMRH